MTRGKPKKWLMDVPMDDDIDKATGPNPTGRQNADSVGRYLDRIKAADPENQNTNTSGNT